MERKSRMIASGGNQFPQASLLFDKGATEYRVCGRIDTEKALTEGAKAFEPGIGILKKRKFLSSFQKCTKQRSTLYLFSWSLAQGISLFVWVLRSVSWTAGVERPCMATWSSISSCLVAAACSSVHCIVHIPVKLFLRVLEFRNTPRLLGVKL